MSSSTLEGEILEALNEVPILDGHSHLVGGKLAARGLHDIILYHMSVSDLYAAGCPSGARLTQYPGWADEAEAHARIEEALPHFPRVRNTGIQWGNRIILADFYDFHEPVTAENWRALDARVRERADDRSWQRDVLRRARIKKGCTELARREQGQDDDILHYSLEWAFFTRCQWGEFDTALYELERCWGRLPESPSPIGGTRPKPEREITSLEDVHEALRWYVEHIPEDQVLSTATHLSTDINYRPVTEAEMRAALSRRATAGPAERDIYASYVNELLLNETEKHFSDRVQFQFSFGAEPLPFETASRVNQTTIAQLAEMIGRHPGIRFQCHVSVAHANQALCSLCRELPNLSLAAYWWHNFQPTIIQRIISERLDWLPLNRQLGFFSDAYCVEWAYAKAVIVRRILANVLAEKIRLGQYDMELALSIAHEILYITPQTLNGMSPSPAL